jgi:hypothetical protein
VANGWAGLVKGLGENISGLEDEDKRSDYFSKASIPGLTAILIGVKKMGVGHRRGRPEVFAPWQK